MRFSVGSRVDGYDILNELGEGAYAETYLARDVGSGRLVVLKAPNPDLFADPAIFQRYRREAEIARSLDHPGVQRAFAPTKDGDDEYLVLEYVEGENLRRRMNEVDPAHKGVPIPTALDWGRQLANALAYLHDHGIVHRDLKPENILVDGDDHLKIADFGSALLDGAKRLTWKHLTDSVGTPDYMSPEQIQGDRGDQRSDIYAWGVMMYELLTGNVPFRGDTWMATMAGHLTKSPDALEHRRRDVAPGLAAVVMHAMRRYPEHRYQHMSDVLADLDRLDQVGADQYDRAPEPPMGGMGAAGSTRKMWLTAIAISLGVIALCAVIVVLSLAL
jgi:serine/threonine-protein kinase